MKKFIREDRANMLIELNLISIEAEETNTKTQK